MDRAALGQLADFSFGEAGFEQLSRTRALGSEDHRALAGREGASQKVGRVAYVLSVCQLVDSGAGVLVGEDAVLGWENHCAAGGHRSAPGSRVSCHLETSEACSDRPPIISQLWSQRWIFAVEMGAR